VSSAVNLSHYGHNIKASQSGRATCRPTWHDYSLPRNPNAYQR